MPASQAAGEAAKGKRANGKAEKGKAGNGKGRAGRARSQSRLPQILDSAAAQFAAKGYQAASIRDIVQDVGMLAGSLYYHFATKEELLEAVYAEGVRRITEAVAAAVARESDPWARLEAGCIAHLEALLDRSAYAQVVVNIDPTQMPASAERLVALRDGYEAQFAALVEALPLPPGCSARMLRLMLLGALNWTTRWHRPDGPASPAEIARDFVRLLKADLQPA